MPCGALKFLVRPVAVNRHRRSRPVEKRPMLFGALKPVESSIGIVLAGVDEWKSD
jgi:hypothetical protein